MDAPGLGRARASDSAAGSKVDPATGQCRQVRLYVGAPRHLRNCVSAVPQPFPFCPDLGAGRYQTKNPFAQSSRKRAFGPKGIRTPDLFNAIEALSQLSYRPSQRIASCAIVAPSRECVNIKHTRLLNFVYSRIHQNHAENHEKRVITPSSKKLKIESRLSHGSEISRDKG